MPLCLDGKVGLPRPSNMDGILYSILVRRLSMSCLTASGLTIECISLAVVLLLVNSIAELPGRFAVLHRRPNVTDEKSEWVSSSPTLPPTLR